MLAVYQKRTVVVSVLKLQTPYYGSNSLKTNANIGWHVYPLTGETIKNNFQQWIE